MIWPPVKAWTSTSYQNGQVHFVAINYGGKLLDRWVILMSVLDSGNVQKVSERSTKSRILLFMFFIFFF